MEKKKESTISLMKKSREVILSLADKLEKEVEELKDIPYGFEHRANLYKLILEANEIRISVRVERAPRWFHSDGPAGYRDF